MFIKDLGIAAADIYHSLPDDEKAAVVVSLGQVFVANWILCPGSSQPVTIII
jgi:hypothetical protein